MRRLQGLRCPKRIPRLKLLLEPRTLLGLGAGISLLVLLGSLADWREVAGLARQLPPGLLVLPAVAHLFGAACRVLRWLLMLRGGGVQLPWRAAVATWFGADLFGPLPASPLMASYLLHRTGAASAAATVPVVLAGLWVEMVVVVGGTALIPDAMPLPVRITAALVSGAALLGALLLRLRAAHLVIWMMGRGVAGAGRRLMRSWRGGERWWSLLEELSRWTPSLGGAFSPATLLPGVLLTALPLLAGASLTAAIATALGYPQLTPLRAWSAGGTVMMLAILSPLPFDLGVVEGGNVLTYSWLGVPPAAALTIGLLGRVWATTLGLLLAAVATWLLRKELT